MGYDVQKVRADFPILAEMINGKPLVYLDSANSTQKPRHVIDAMTSFMSHSYAPVNRSSYRLAGESNDLYEGARASVRRFINAPKVHEVVFTKNATEALNLVVQTWGRTNLGPDDVVVLTHMEHHANIVPWFQLQAEKGFEIRWVPLTADGQLDLTDLDRLLDGAKVFAFTAMSNVLGTTNDVAALSAAARRAGAAVLVDACQSIPHEPTDISTWDVDFVAFSGHKMVGPTGIGGLWGRREILEAMPPFLGGGEMIRDVRKDGFTTNDVPWKFEAGTPAIAEAVGLGAAVTWLEGIGMDAIADHERRLTAYALERLTDALGDAITIYGPATAEGRGSAISFLVDGIHAHDISQVLDEDAVCVRAGHHCAKPLMRELGVPATTRASLAVYNDTDDVDALVEALGKARAFFAL